MNVISLSLPSSISADFEPFNIVISAGNSMLNEYFLGAVLLNITVHVLFPITLSIINVFSLNVPFCSLFVQSILGFAYPSLGVTTSLIFSPYFTVLVVEPSPFVTFKLIVNSFNANITLQATSLLIVSNVNVFFVNCQQGLQKPIDSFGKQW